MSCWLRLPAWPTCPRFCSGYGSSGIDQGHQGFAVERGQRSTGSVHAWRRLPARQAARHIGAATVLRQAGLPGNGPACHRRGQQRSVVVGRRRPGATSSSQSMSVIHSANADPAAHRHWPPTPAPCAASARHGVPARSAQRCERGACSGGCSRSRQTQHVEHVEHAMGLAAQEAALRAGCPWA